MQKKRAKKKIEVASYISTPRVAGNNKGKSKKLSFLVERNYWHFKLSVSQVLSASSVHLFRIGLSFFTITFQLYNYLTVYCNTRIKTVKSIKTIKYQC